MTATAVPSITIDQYADLCERTGNRWEYHDHQAFPLGEATIQHGKIIARLAYLMIARLRDNPCSVMGASQVEIPRESGRGFCLPDLAVYCGRPKVSPDRLKALQNPKVIFEVLSPSTGHYDASEKFELYQAIPSLEEYVLVSQAKPKIAVFTKNQEGWQLRSYDGWNAVASLFSLDITLPLAEVYAGVDFEV